jgi:hypothetical protein
VFKDWEFSVGAEYSPNVQLVDDGTGILGSTAQGTIMRSREVGAILGLAYHF